MDDSKPDRLLMNSSRAVVSVPAAQGQQRQGSPTEIAQESVGGAGGQKCLEAMHMRRTCSCLWGGLHLSLFPSCKAAEKMV